MEFKKSILIATIVVLSFILIYPIMDRIYGSSESNIMDHKPIFTGKRRHLPHCIIIGVGKCGTRALLKFLGLHPDIVTAQKETNFFNEHYEKGLAYYLSQMPLSREHQLTIEKTPHYFESQHAPERIRAMNSSIKLIVIVKDPVTTLISSYVQQKLNKGLKGTFEANSVMPNGEFNATRLKKPVYYTRMKHWLDYFPRRQIHVADGNALIKNPASEMDKVQNFLGIQRNITEENFYFSKEKGFFCLRDWQNNNKCLSNSKGRPHPKVGAAVVAKLKAYYKPYNKLFYDLVGVDFGWDL